MSLNMDIIKSLIKEDSLDIIVNNPSKFFNKYKLYTNKDYTLKQKY